MVLKSDLFTAGEEKQKPRAPIHAITTQDKIAKAEARKQNQKNLRREAPEPSKPKPRTLAPPGELALNRMLAAQFRKELGRRTPLTTQQKIRAAEAAKRAKDPMMAKAKVQKREKGKTERKLKPPRMMAVLRSHDASVKAKIVQPAEGPSLPLRRTRRADKYARDMAARNAGHPKTATVSELGLAKDNQKLYLMDLPKDVRLEIWKLAVIETEVFIWPDTPIGCEQPDLAMVNRQLRSEVLPVFYHENTFAVDLTAPQIVGRKTAKDPKNFSSGVSAARWIAMLESTRRLSMVRRWAFSSDMSNAVISVRLMHKEDIGWTANVEIHSEAVCILPGHVEFQKCQVKNAPEWLNKEVFRVLDGARTGDLHGETIVNLASAVKARWHDLAVHQCEAT